MVTINLTDSEAKQLSAFLADLSEKYGNAGCNDYWMENTDENWYIWKEIYKDIDDYKDEKRPNRKQKISCSDFMVVEYLKGKIDDSIKRRVP